MRRICTRLQREQAFGLVELIIAMTMLAVGLLSLVAAFSSGYVTINRASTTGTASLLADKKMEAYRATTFSSITPGTTTTSASSTSVPPSPDGKSYTITSTISATTAPGTSRTIKVITVVVTDANGREWARETSSFDALTGT